MKIRIFILMGLFWAVLPKNVQAQFHLEETNQPFISVAIGNSIIDEALPEGNDYSPLTMLGRYSLWRWKKLTVFGELQLVQAVSREMDQTDYEFGTNFGFQFNQALFDRFDLVAGISSGPHYISVETDLQANGFIFSDNFELGFQLNLPEFGTFFVTKARFRHISNAGLKSPNLGIDNFFLIFELGKFL